MKAYRIISALLTAMAIIALSFISTAPANANTGSIGYCQATSSDRNPYHFITASIDSLLDKDGNFKQGGVNANDIVPKFSYINKEGTRRYFDGQKTTKETLTAADCPGGPKLVLAAPNDPTYVPASCANPAFPYGKVNVPSDLGTGVGSASVPELSADNSQFSLFYTLKDDTKDAYYQWKDVAGETKPYFFATTHISSDPLWIVDEKTGVGQCELSNTGGGITELAVMIGGGALGLGMVFLGTVALLNRRQVA